MDDIQPVRMSSQRVRRLESRTFPFSNSLNSLPFVPLKIIANIGAISSSLV
jgi:hypothetical protein